MPFMFSGCFGTGKTSLARIFGRAILCENIAPDFEPCNKCKSCKSFLEGTNPAYMEIDAASYGGVDDIRKLKEESNFNVLGGYDKRVLVIDECHSITKMGNEALLKQLEDIIGNQIYIFCTTSPENMHDAVRSRCFEFNLNQISKDSIFSRLKLICNEENISYSENALKIIANVNAPHMRDALKHLDYLSNFGEISDDIVFNHFQLLSQLDFLKLIFNLKDNFLESDKILQKIILKQSVPDIYEGLANSLIKVYKLKIGLNDFNNEEESLWGEKILNLLNENIPRILDFILARNRYVDTLTLESDLIILNKKLNGFSVNFDVVENNTPVIVNKIEKSQDNKIIENPDKTLEILKRYKSYSEPLAVMMDRSKNSNSLKSKQTVELKKVKDFKHNVSKNEIKNFIDSKRGSS